MLSIATSICTCFEIHYGLGRHVAALTLPNIVHDLKALYASIILYNTCIAVYKTSILITYHRINNSKITGYFIYFALTFVLLYGVTGLLSEIWTCIPIALFWDMSLKGHCVSRSTLYFANAGINIASDIMILVLPVLILKDVMMPIKQKLVIMGVLAFGGAAVLSSVLRLKAIYTLTHSDDPTWDGAAAAYWSVIEINLGIMCACISSYRPLVRKIMPYIFGSRSGRSAQSGKNDASTAKTRRSGLLTIGTGGRNERSRRAGDATGAYTEFDDGDSDNKAMFTENVVVKKEVDIELGVYGQSGSSADERRGVTTDIYSGSQKSTPNNLNYL